MFIDTENHDESDKRIQMTIYNTNHTNNTNTHLQQQTKINKQTKTNEQCFYFIIYKVPLFIYFVYLLFLVNNI